METVTCIRQEKSPLEFSHQNKTHLTNLYLSLLIMLKALFWTNLTSHCYLCLAFNIKGY